MTMPDPGADWAIAHILAGYEDDWLGRYAREAPSDAEAVKIMRHYAVGSGFGAGAPRVERFACLYSHIEYVTPDGTAGRLSWLELARAARRTVVQLGMFEVSA